MHVYASCKHYHGACICVYVGVLLLQVYAVPNLISLTLRAGASRPHQLGAVHRTRNHSRQQRAFSNTCFRWSLERFQRPGNYWASCWLVRWGSQSKGNLHRNHETVRNVIRLALPEAEWLVSSVEYFFFLKRWCTNIFTQSGENSSCWQYHHDSCAIQVGQHDSSTKEN